MGVDGLRLDAIPYLVERDGTNCENLDETHVVIRKLRAALAEQNTNVALRYASYGYILESGRVVLDGDAAALRYNEDVKEFYLGLSGSGRKSFRDIKSYKRRKRWL
jgi:branched-chain amino acid transport system ATP-binding protein